MKKKNLDPFTQLVRTVGPCASMDDTRVRINRIRVRDGLAYATDNHRLVVTETSVPAGDYIRAGKGTFVLGEASDKFPNFDEVRPKETVEAYQLPIAVLRTDAVAIELGVGTDSAFGGRLFWDRPGNRGLPDTQNPGLVARFDASVIPTFFGNPWPTIRVNARYLREVAHALGWDVDDGMGVIPLRLDPANIDLIVRHRTALADAKTRGGPDAKRPEPRYSAPVEIRPPNSASDTCYGLVMPIRL